MRAAVLHEPGQPPTFRDHPDPQPLPGRTVVRVTAAPLVPLDLLCASGTSYFGRPAVPYVPGVQGVGLVESSQALPAGSRVWFSTSAGMAPGDGSLAERCLVADEDLVPLDAVPLEAEVPDEHLAALGLSAIAAWMALSWRAGLRPGERVLVLGGGGAVGQAGIGAARVLGASRVIAVARSREAQDRARERGADAVVEMVADVDELSDRLRAAAAEVDVVLDPVFGAGATAACRTLSPGGRLVNLGGASGDEAVLSSSVLRGRSASVLGYTNNSLSPQQRREALQSVLRHASAGRIAVSYDAVALADVAAGWRRQAAGEATRRLVLRP